MSARKRFLSISLKRSLIGRPEKHRRIIKGLGLRRLHQFVIRPDTPEIRGMLKKVSHLVEVKEDENQR